MSTIFCMSVGLLVHKNVQYQQTQINRTNQETFYLLEEVEGLQEKVDSMSNELEKLRETHPYQSRK
jgi:peptidoglycan hydrolase CwlO-like protein